MGAAASLKAEKELAACCRQELNDFMASLGTTEREKLRKALDTSTDLTDRPLWVLEFDPKVAGNLTGKEGRLRAKDASPEAVSATPASASSILRLPFMRGSHVDGLLRAASDWAALLPSSADSSKYALAPDGYLDFVRKRIKSVCSQVKDFKNRSGAEHISFDVDAVPLAKKPLKEVPVNEILNLKCLCLSTTSNLVKPRDIGTYQTYSEHPLLSAVHFAFADHRPLVLSPDAVWLTISQGVALHLRNNTEGLRAKLGISSQQGRKQTLTVTSLPFERDSIEAWQDIVEGFAWTAGEQSEQMFKLQKLLTCDFSTTGSEERCASNAVFLESVKNYFDYQCAEICGIPMITLEGSVADWQDLITRVDKLDAMNLDLEFWTGHLREILEQFATASKGSPDVPFWRRIYKLREAYGSQGFTGWVGCLFPYCRDGFGATTFTRKNQALKYKMALHGWGEKREECSPFSDSEEDQNGNFENVEGSPGVIVGKAPKLDNEDFPSGLSCFDFTLKESDGSSIVCQFLAGFFGIEQGQGPDRRALRPRIAWAVVEAAGLLAQLRRLAEDPQHYLVTNATNRKMPMAWPKELRLFYAEFERCDLHCTDTGAVEGASFVWPEEVFTVDSTGWRNDWFQVASFPEDGGMLLVAYCSTGSAMPEFYYAKKVLQAESKRTHESGTSDGEGTEDDNAKEEDSECDEHEEDEDVVEMFKKRKSQEIIDFDAWGHPMKCGDCYVKSKGFAMSIWNRWQPEPDWSQYCLDCWDKNWQKHRGEVAKENQMIEEFANVPPPMCIARSLNQLLLGLCSKKKPYFLEPGWEVQKEQGNQDDEDELQGEGAERQQGQRPIEPLKREPCAICDSLDLPGWCFRGDRFVCEECVKGSPPDSWKNAEEEHEF